METYLKPEFGLSNTVSCTTGRRVRPSKELRKQFSFPRGEQYKILWFCIDNDPTNHWNNWDLNAIYGTPACFYKK